MLADIHLAESARKTQAFLMGQAVKDLPAMQETQVLTLDGEDPLEKGMSICFKSTVLTAISVQLLSLV